MTDARTEVGERNQAWNLKSFMDSLIVELDSTLTVSIVGAAVIVTRSCTAETFRFRFRLIAWPTVRLRFSCATVV